MVRLIAVVLVLSIASPAWAQNERTDLPECGTIQGLGDGLAAGFYAYARVLYGVLTTITPDPGVRVDDAGQVYATVGWPLQVAIDWGVAKEELNFGPCAKKFVETYPIPRVVLEPIVSATYRNQSVEIGFDTRAAYRMMWHGAESTWGIGGGIGSAVNWTDGIEASLSPEVLIQYGECCTPSYLTVSLRYDHYFAEDKNVFGVSGGWSFW